MNYLSVSKIAKKWGISERTVRNYCAQGKIAGAFLTGKTWNIPQDALPPARTNAKKFSDNNLLNILKEEKERKIKGGIYYRMSLKTLMPVRACALRDIVSAAFGHQKICPSLLLGRPAFSSLNCRKICGNYEHYRFLESPIKFK
ncbi:MAG: helix-turn-helix domain-containing protein [Endomicrobium sp.]|jgi:hypothetical protein|nr:helix-turn-helix domain-containing protein [Endomicrobium sp.]